MFDNVFSGCCLYTSDIIYSTVCFCMCCIVYVRLCGVHGTKKNSTNIYGRTPLGELLATGL